MKTTMLASLSSIYDNIRSYSLSGRKPGDKRRRERYSVVPCLMMCICMVRKKKIAARALVEHSKLMYVTSFHVEFD